MPSLSQLFRRRHAQASSTLVLTIVCAGVVLASLDLFIVNVALPDMARDLGAHSLGELSWILNAYAIVYAALLVLFGRLAEGHSRERGFLLGVATFSLASAACGAATGVWMLVAFRIVQAAGAALLTPTSLGLVLATTAPERRHGAVRAWTAIGGLAAALGPVVGGILVTASWRWVFLVNVPIGLATLAVGSLRLPHVPGHDVERPDPLGAVLVTLGVGALALGLVTGADWGWTSTATLAVLVGAAGLLAGFVAHCLHVRNPLVDPGLFRVRTFSSASLIGLIFSTAFGAMLLSIVLWCQDVWGWSALQTGLAIAPGPLMVPLFSFLVAGHLIARLESGATIAAGATIFAGGAGWWLAMTTAASPNYLTAMLPGILLTGIGVGLTVPTFMATAASSLPPQSFATGSGVVNMMRQVGLAIGVALLVAILGAPATPQESDTAFHHAWTLTAAVSLLAALIAVASLPVAWRRRTLPTAAAGHLRPGAGTANSSRAASLAERPNDA